MKFKIQALIKGNDLWFSNLQTLKRSCEFRIESETHHRTNSAGPKPKCFHTDIDFVLALICDASPASGSLFNLIPKYSFSPIGCLIRLYLQGSPIKVDLNVFFSLHLAF